MACVFEVSNSEHGAQHHIYRLVKEWEALNFLLLLNRPLFIDLKKKKQPQNKWQCLYLKVTPTMLFGHGIGWSQSLWICFNIMCLLFDCSCDLRYSCFMFKYGNSCLKYVKLFSFRYKMWPFLKDLLDSFGKWKCARLSALFCRLRKKGGWTCSRCPDVVCVIYLSVFCMSVVSNFWVYLLSIYRQTPTANRFSKETKLITLHKTVGHKYCRITA